jgi:hypothetical protein
MKKISSILFLSVTMLLSTALHAQQKIAFNFVQPPEVVGKYTQRNSLEVGDVAAHTINLSEIVTTYVGDKPAPTFSNVRVKESRTILTSDFTNNSGFSSGYRTYTMDNGDKIFIKTSLILQTGPAADGKSVSFATTVDTITGGTGKFKNIRGTLRSSNKTTVGSTTSGTQTEGEYYFLD